MGRDGKAEYKVIKASGKQVDIDMKLRSKKKRIFLLFTDLSITNLELSS
jgi:hypothetical protein